MGLTFQKLDRAVPYPNQAHSIGFLKPDNWDDFGFKTLFFLTVFDEHGVEHELGNVKIGYAGHSGGWTSQEIPDHFDSLNEEIFSLGQDPDYYRNIMEGLSSDIAENLLSVLGDVAKDSDRLSMAEQEQVFETSLLRTVNKSAITNQYRRILAGGVPLTNYDFFYEKETDDKYSGVKVEFRVKPNSTPSTNIHTLIGRNGVGKTTLLNNMIKAILPNLKNPKETGYFAQHVRAGPFVSDSTKALADDYFNGVVSISFSAFDPFTPPPTQADANLGPCYHYIGLKRQENDPERGLMDPRELRNDFIESIKICLSLKGKRDRWVNSVQKLESDFNFAEMELCRLAEIAIEDETPEKEGLAHAAGSAYSRLSSGHAVVLLTVTKLIQTVEEKTLVLIDEPESHLHPPLLSAFTRALSDLMINRNGVAIIATHSPVILQEVPKSCVSILQRTRLVGSIYRPESETFGENVGVLTREIFGLEVSKSGFHDLLAKSVSQGHSYEEILAQYQDQLGYEGKAVLRALLANANNDGE